MLNELTKNKAIYQFDHKSILPICHLSGLEIKRGPNEDCIQVTVNEKKLPKQCKATLIHYALEELQTNPKKTVLVRALNAYLQHRKAPVDVALFSKVGLYLGSGSGSIGMLYLTMSLGITAVVNLDIGIDGAIGMALGLVAGVWICMFLSTLIGQIVGSLIGKCLNFNRVNVRHEIELSALLTHSIVPISPTHSSVSNLLKINDTSGFFFYVIDEKLSENEQIIISENKLGGNIDTRLIKK
jgi:hypothetical protein